MSFFAQYDRYCKALSYASGEYLMFCDADDWLALEAVDHLYQHARQEYSCR